MRSDGSLQVIAGCVEAKNSVIAILRDFKGNLGGVKYEPDSSDWL